MRKWKHSVRVWERDYAGLWVIIVNYVYRQKIDMQSRRPGFRGFGSLACS